MTVEIIDLTHVLREGMVGHPAHGRTPVRLDGTLRHSMYAGTNRRSPYDGSVVSFANEQWVINGNTGTHMDSVWHGNPESVYTADQMPITCGLGTAVWLDCSFVKAPGGQVTPDVLEEAEQRSGEQVQRADIVLIHTGWSDFVTADPSTYLNQHMGLNQAAGEWLRHRGARTVGIDNTTVETVAGAYESPVHMNFLRPGALGLREDDFIAIIENLVHIDRIRSHRFHFVGLPLPFAGGSGSPIRAIAVIESKEGN